jgi:hypothetical protein
MNKNNFIALPEQTRRNVFIEAATRKALPAVAVEKDWRITVVLHALFSLPYLPVRAFISIEKNALPHLISVGDSH